MGRQIYTTYYLHHCLSLHKFQLAQFTRDSRGYDYSGWKCLCGVPSMLLINMRSEVLATGFGRVERIPL